MTLVDAGPLIALLDRREPRHGDCVQALAAIAPPLTTTWPVLTEAMFLLGDRIGWTAQERLWELVLRGDIEPASIDAGLAVRARELMEKYRDLPMDLADATLVALAEARGTRRVFTLDGDFRVYRFRGRQPFDLAP